MKQKSTGEHYAIQHKQNSYWMFQNYIKLICNKQNGIAQNNAYQKYQSNVKTPRLHTVQQVINCTFSTFVTSIFKMSQTAMHSKTVSG